MTDTNPQIEMGIDLETRIKMASQEPVNLEILNEEILLRIDILILELCRAKSVSPMHVYEISISGTTGMLHLFLKGVPGVLEQRSLLNGGKSGAFSAGQLEFRAPARARIYTLPVISSYVGADITAAILATQLHCSSETILLLDLGSATRAILHHRGDLVASSIFNCGVFDGAGVRFGMRPETGAIERVRLDDDVRESVIGESLPRGICGSGLIELAAELKRCGVVNDRGEFLDTAAMPHVAPAVRRRVVMTGGQRAFLLYTDSGEFQTDMYITQHDISMIVNAKASVAAVVLKLLESVCADGADVSKIFIGGAFGKAIHLEAFFELGFFSERFRGRLFFAGNTVKKGTQMALLNRNILLEAEKLVQRVRSLPSPGDTVDEAALHLRPLL